MRRIMLSSVASLAIFLGYIVKGKIFGGLFSNCVLIFSTVFGGDIYDSGKNSVNHKVK